MIHVSWFVLSLIFVNVFLRSMNGKVSLTMVDFFKTDVNAGFINRSIMCFVLRLQDFLKAISCYIFPFKCSFGISQ